MNHDIAQLLGGSRWLIEPNAFRALIERAKMATPEAIQAAVAAYGQREQGPKMIGDIAVIEVCGPITYKSSWLSMYLGGTSIEELQAKLRAALGDPAARAIVFRWDSPGGTVEMVPEFGDELFAARGQKPIYSVADTMICSAAFWLAAQTDVIYASVSSILGSIGVYCEHDDISGMLEQAGVKITLISHGAHKVDGNMYEPLSATAREEMQRQVDELGEEFETAAARGRGVTKKFVQDSFGQGKVFRGKQAIGLGMADKLSTFAQVMTKLTKGRVAGLRAAASGVAGGVRASGPDDTTGDDGVEPVDGECPDGYELDAEDGLCYVRPTEDDAAASAAIAEEHLIISSVIK